MYRSDIENACREGSVISDLDLEEAEKEGGKVLIGSELKGNIRFVSIRNQNRSELYHLCDENRETFAQRKQYSQSFTHG
jgi:hypothetical protein